MSRWLASIRIVAGSKVLHRERHTIEADDIDGAMEKLPDSTPQDAITEEQIPEVTAVYVEVVKKP